ncbi:hypothetical protein KAR91_03650 [Candidatus Pacearchaeota archaeon]|nr:hypothetical protein [Candidatus Pacearchaeota archaeon]
MTEHLMWGIEPAQVLIASITIGGAIIAFQFKINRCLGKMEANYKNLDSRLKTIAESYLSHLDK